MEPSRPEADRFEAIFERFRRADPHPRDGLAHTPPFRMLVSVLMSAQSTGATVARVADALFGRAASPAAMLNLGQDGIAAIIKPVGLGATKARHIAALSRALLDRYDGQVPRDRAALTSLPGIGRKSADIVLNFAFDEPVIAVDTHVYRVSHRLPLAVGRTPERVADGLLDVVPDGFRRDAHLWLFKHGRDTCTARRPACPRCVLEDLCRWPGKGAA